jgi:predicted ester cyclase
VCYTINIIQITFPLKELLMSVEQIARDVITMMTDVEKTKAHFTADAVVSGGVLPQPMPAKEAINLIGGLMTAFPDIKFDVQQVSVDGNRATVNVVWSGTNTGPFSLPMPGMPSIPPTGKKVSVKDSYVVTVEGDKVSHLHVESPADGGIPAALAQIGVKMPSM